MKLSLYYPVTPIHFNQYFGQNLNPIYKKEGLPGHNGIDFMASHGQPIYASHDGWASFQIDSAGGHGVVLITDQQFDDGNGGQCYFKTIYWHMCDGLKEPKFQSPIADKTGFVKVSRGDLLGYADSTGQSTGDHLHFGLKKVAQGENWGTWYNLEQNNGYQGAIDPAPYFNGLFARYDIPQPVTYNADVTNALTKNPSPIWRKIFLSMLDKFGYNYKK